MDQTAILVSNFTNALEQVNRYLGLGLLTALSVLVVDVTSSSERDTKVESPLIPIPMTADTAKWVLLAVYAVAGIMAYTATRAALESANMLVLAEKAAIARGETGALSLVTAACTYASIATAEYVLRVPAVLLPPILAGSVVWRIYRRLEKVVPEAKYSAFGMTAVAAWPYLAMAWGILKMPCSGS